MDFLGNQMRMNFPENRMGDGFSWGSNGDFFLLPPSPPPPFDFRENSSSFDCRENPCNTPKGNKKKCFLLADRKT